jgi:hypothetical protein
MENSNIQTTFNQFITNHNELEKIRKDINTYTKQFKNRIQQLKKENEEQEKILIKYLDENKLPGIRSGEFLLLADEKPISNNKQFREKKVQNILQQHQIDPSSNIYKELVEAISTSKIMEKTEKKIKFKKYSSTIEIGK